MSLIGNHRPLLTVPYNRDKGLVSYWSMSETSGTTLTDRGPKRHDGLASATGLFSGGGFTTNGTTQYGSVADHPDYFSADFSTFGWVKGAANQDNTAPWSKYNAGAAADGNWGWFTYVDSGLISFVINGNGVYNTGQTKNYKTSLTVMDGTWHSIGARFEGGVLTVFVDGVEDTAVTKLVDDAVTNYDSAARMLFGAVDVAGVPDLFWAGTSKKIRYYNIAKSDDDFAAMHKEGLTSTDPDVVDWINAVYVAGGKVSQARADLVTTFVTDLKTASSGNLYSLCDGLFFECFADESEEQALVNIARGHQTASYSNGTLDANGFQATSGADYVGKFDTGLNPTDLGGNFTQNSAFAAAYVFNNRTTNSESYVISANGPNGMLLDITPLWASGGGGTWIAINDNTGGEVPSTPGGTAMGMWIETRTGASALAAYKDGSTTTFLATGTLASNGLINTSVASGAVAAANLPGDQIGFTGLGGALTSSQAGDFAAAVNAVMTDLGKNVY